MHFDYLRAVRRFREVTGLSLEVIERNFYFSEWERLYSRGKISSGDFFEKLRKDLNLKIDFETFANIWNDIFWLNGEVADLMQALKEKYRLAALTNTTDLHFRYWLENFPALGMIDLFFASHELGMRKPEEGLFRLVLERLASRPEEVVFVDDMEENARAAQALGIPTIHYRTGSNLRVDLRALGLEV